MLTTIRRQVRDTAYPRFERASTAIVPGTGEEVGVNEPRYVGGNYSLRFVDGSDQYGLRVDGYPQFGRGDFTFEAWIKPSGSGDRTIFSRGNINSDSGVLLRLNNNNTLRLIVVDDSGGATNNPISNDPLPNGQWSHVVITREGGVSRSYVNGQLKGTWHHEKGGIISPGNDRITFGALAYHPSTARFDGLIARPRIYNVALTDQEVSARYSKQEVTRGLGLYYPLHEGQGTTAHDTAERINLLPTNVANGGEDGTTDGFNPIKDATISSVTEESYIGERSIKAITPGLSRNEGLSIDNVPIYQLTNDQYVGSVWIRGDGELALGWRNRYQLGTIIKTKSIQLSGDWERHDIVIDREEFQDQTYISLHVTTPYFGDPRATTFYIDGLQLQEGTEATPWTPPKLQPYDGTIEGAEFDQDNPFFEQGGFGSGLLVEEGTTNQIFVAGYQSWFANLNVGESTDRSVGGGTIRFTRLGEHRYRAEVIADCTYPILGLTSSFTWPANQPHTISAYILDYYEVPGTTGRFGLGRTNFGSAHLHGADGLGRKTYTHQDTTDINTGFAVRASYDALIKAGTYIEWEFAQVELNKPYATTFTTGTRAPEDINIPVPGVIDFVKGQMDFDVYLPEGYSTIGHPNNRSRYLFSFSNNNEFRCFWSRSNNRWFFIFNGGPGYISGNLTPEPGHRRFTMVWNANEVRVYCDGVFLASGPRASHVTSVTHFQLGRRDSTHFNSSLYGFRILTEPMSDADIAAEYGKPLSVTPTTTYLLDFNRNLRQQQGTTYLPRFRGSQAVVL